MDAAVNVEPSELPCGSVSVVILTHNSREKLNDCLAAMLPALRDLEYEVIVVDNASTDGSLGYLQSLRENNRGMLVLENSANLGIGGGRNVGLRAAKNDYVLVLDDDIYVDHQTLAAFPKSFVTRPETGIIAFQISDVRSGRILNNLGDSECFAANFAGAAHALRRLPLLQVGGYDEECCYGAEELDVSIRMLACGYNTMYLPHLKAVHHHLEHVGPELVQRRCLWAYNWTRVIRRHFRGIPACCMALRMLLGPFRKSWSESGVFSALRVVSCALRGWRRGRATYARLPDDVVSFYAQPTLKPDCGNVPISHKLIRRLKNIASR